MPIPEFNPPIKEQLIRPEKGISLQEQVSRAVAQGVGRILLEGTFTARGEGEFSLLTLMHDLEIIGENEAVLDGQNRSAHLLFIADGVKVSIKGISFIKGDTQDVISQVNLENHPQTRLNIFRYLDGGAVSMGAGSELVLEDCVFDSNHSAVCGGAISNLGGYLHLVCCVFTNNSCGDTGAAVDNLATGSLTVIEQCRFSHNRANQLGAGIYGTVTAFPNTFLIVRDSDFSQETATAIDYRPNNSGQAFISIDQKTKFKSAHAIVQNPVTNRGVRKVLFTRYMRLLARHPGFVKLEGVPKADKAKIKKHSILFKRLIAE